MRAADRYLIPWITVLTVSLLTGCAATAQPTGKKDSEHALAVFSDMESKDISVQLDQLKQEVFIAEQKIIGLEYLMTQSCCVKMDFVRYPSGKDLIPGYIFTPPQIAPDRRYPAVVLVHGGFHQHFNVEWFALIAELIKRGYVVIFPEYRSSQGYGETIYKNDYGTTDVADVLAAAAYFSGKPYVDASRLGIIGESRGGMVTLLAIEQEPERFKAAVDIVGLADFVAYMAYKPDWRRKQVAQESPSFGGKLPDQNLAAYMKVSPINHVEKIKAPLLVLATTGDEIAPLDLHTGRLLDALKARGKTFEAKIYDHAPGGHVFLHGDTPERDDGYNRIFAWLEKYLHP